MRVDPLISIPEHRSVQPGGWGHGPNPPFFRSQQGSGWGYVNIELPGGVAMPRAKHPEPYQIGVGLSRQGWRVGDDWDLIGRKVVSRLYDRASGNFKAVGWIVEITYRQVVPNTDPLGQELRTVQVPLLDGFMPNYVQTSL